MIPDWQLPKGVTRGVWNYAHDSALAQAYDAHIAESSLFSADMAFVARHCSHPGKLIDLGCGTGRLLVAMAKTGHDVLGVDLSQEMLNVARTKAENAGVTVRLVKGNIVELDAFLDQSFDYATCLFSTLGMINGVAERKAALGHAFRLLRPGGIFILHVHNFWFNFWDPAGRRWLLKDLYQSLLRNPNAGDRTMPSHEGLGELTLHHFTRRDAAQLLTAAGFQVQEVLPVGLGPDGRLPWPKWFGWLRAYGYLLAAKRV